MRRALPAAALLALGACVSASPWERKERLDVGRLHVPRVFAPLVPGSMYPDRTHPLPARGLPAVVVVSHRLRAKEIAEALGRRWIVSLVEVPDSRWSEALDALRARSEAGGKMGLFLEAPDPALLRAALARGDVAAVVVAGAPGPLPERRPPLLVLRAGAPEGLALAGAAERWYAPASGRLPAGAIQDAADWLAERLQTH